MKAIATLQHNIFQHCWPYIWKIQPDDRNIFGRNRLRAFGHPVATVATCCVWKIELVRMPVRSIIAGTWLNNYNIMQHAQMVHVQI